MIAELKQRYDIVFFDSPPMLGVSDASVLASEVDQTIIVVQHRRFPRAMLTRVKQAVLGVGGTVLGVVLNNVDLKARSELLLLHQLLRLLSAARQRNSPRRAAARQRPPPSGQRLFRAGRLLMRASLSFFVSFFGLPRALSARPRLRVGDPIEIKIGGVPIDEQTQVNNTYTVDANGSINLPYINKVKAEGLTPAQLARAIEETYRAEQDLHEPEHHDPDAADFAFRERRRRRSHSLARAFHRRHDAAHGDQRRRRFQRFCRSKRVRLLRGNEVKIYDVRQFRRDPSQDVKLQPGDRVEVPQSFF